MRATDQFINYYPNRTIELLKLLVKSKYYVV